MKLKSKFIIVMFLLVLTSCTGTRVRDEVLLPAVQLTWPKVYENIERGLVVALGNEEITSQDSAFIILELMDDAIKSGIREKVIGISFGVLKPYAYKGIQDMVNCGELTPQTAEFLFQRIENFEYALNTLKKETSFLPFPIQREYWVMTDRGSLYYGTKQPPPTSPTNYPAVSGYMQYRYSGRYD